MEVHSQSDHCIFECNTLFSGRGGPRGGRGGRGGPRGGRGRGGRGRGRGRR